MSADVTPERARAWLDANDCDDGVCSLDEGIAFARAYVDACAERDKLRAIIEGRAVAPTQHECRAHFRARGWWLVGMERGGVEVIAGFVRDDRIVRWWPLDAEGRPCAWPVVPT